MSCQKKLYFDEKKHQYTYGCDPKEGEVFISVTTLIGLYKQKFDADYWSYYHGLRKCMGIDDKKIFSTTLRIRHNFDFGDKTKDQILDISRRLGFRDEDLETAQQMVLDEWNVINLKARTKGTNYHNSIEKKHYDDAGIVHEGVFTKLIENLPESLEGLHHPGRTVVIPELRLYNEEFGIAGTMDQAVIYSDMSFDVNDWKTNKKIDLVNNHQKMLFPLNHLDDCNHTHYCLQISIYCWMLEQAGYTPREPLKFTHVILDADGNETERIHYHTHYMRDEVELMLNHYAKNKKTLLSK